MKQAKIKIKINDYIIDEIGTINNEILNLKTKNETIKFDTKNLILIKENKELILKLDFINKQVFYELVKENKKFSNNLIILSLTNNHKQVIINYRIEQTNFLLEINYATIE